MSDSSNIDNQPQTLEERAEALQELFLMNRVCETRGKLSVAVMQLQIDPKQLLDLTLGINLTSKDEAVLEANEKAISQIRDLFQGDETLLSMHLSQYRYLDTINRYRQMLHDDYTPTPRMSQFQRGKLHQQLVQVVNTHAGLSVDQAKQVVALYTSRFHKLAEEVTGTRAASHEQQL